MAANHPDYPGWAALLRWSLAQQDGTKPSDPKAMSAEDRAFLEKVMKELTVDEAQRVGELLKRTEAWLEGDEADAEDALFELEEIVERLDLARDLCKLGGIAVVLRAVKKGSTAACAVIATAAQNDQPAQDAIAKEGALEVLVRAFDDGEDPELRRSALSAISSLIRGSAALEQQFVASTGSYLLATALGPSSPARLAAKAAFLLYALLDDENDSARVPQLEPALRAALQRSTEPPMESENNNTAVWQLRESATNAILQANKANKEWLRSHLHEPMKAAKKHTLSMMTATSSSADHDDDDDDDSSSSLLADLVAKWQEIDWLDNDGDAMTQQPAQQ